jgi:hypothetical protein
MCGGGWHRAGRPGAAARPSGEGDPKLGSPLVAMGSNVSLIFAVGIAASFLLWAVAGWPLAALLVATVVMSLLVGAFSRLATHSCPRCGNRVANGQTRCRACGFDAALEG